MQTRGSYYGKRLNIWKREWTGNLFYHYGTSYSKGLVILTGAKICNDNCKVLHSEDRLMILEVKMNELVYVIFNIYGPNFEGEKNDFIKHICDLYSNVNINQNVLLMGDFNLVMDNTLDVISGLPHKQSIVCNFNKSMMDVNLVDIWRKMNNNKKQFTWSRTEPFVARRLDYCFGSQGLLDRITDCKHIFVPCTDHKGVSVNVALSEMIRGPSYWKFNNSLLNDENYTNMVKS